MIQEESDYNFIINKTFNLIGLNINFSLFSLKTKKSKENFKFRNEYFEIFYLFKT